MARSVLRPGGAGQASVGLCCVLQLLLVSGCDGELVNLGTSTRLIVAGAAGHGGASAGGYGGSGGESEWRVEPEPLLSKDGYLCANATLTAAQDELYFTQQKRGEPDSHVFHVDQVGSGWSEPELVALGQPSSGGEASPAISLDGKELWFGQSLDGGDTDIWLSVDGGEPRNAGTSLNSDTDDAPRPAAMNGTLMPLSSKRHGGTPARYQVYIAARAAIGEAWSEPSQQWLENINQTEHESSDAFLTEDGLELYFASDRSGNPDIYRARRGALDQPFAEPEPLDIDTAAEERDPWLSPDKNTLYFSSNRGPERRLAVYRAQRR